jgi:hypothetical protein
MKRLLSLLLLSAVPVAAQVPPDALDLGTVKAVGYDVRGYTPTVTLSEIVFSRSGGVEPRYDSGTANQRWRDIVPPGWSGPLQFGLIAFVRVNGNWVGGPVHSFWSNRNGAGRKDTGAHPLLPPPPGTSDKANNWQAHWAYAADRWGEMASYVPRQGDKIAFMLAAGSLRPGEVAITVAERSNVLLCDLDYESTCYASPTTTTTTTTGQTGPAGPTGPTTPTTVDPQLFQAVAALRQQLQEQTEWLSRQAQLQYERDESLRQQLERIHGHLVEVINSQGRNSPQPIVNTGGGANITAELLRAIPGALGLVLSLIERGSSSAAQQVWQWMPGTRVPIREGTWVP